MQDTPQGVGVVSLSLPPYQAEACCPKCGHGEVSTFYQDDAHCTSYPRTCVVRRMVREPDCCKAEHLHRTCQRCRYWWAEAVL